MNYNYITKEEVSVTYFQFPKFLLKYPISQNGKMVYMLLYDRARLSQLNNWLDENGWIYVIYIFSRTLHIESFPAIQFLHGICATFAVLIIQYICSNINEKSR